MNEAEPQLTLEILKREIAELKQTIYRSGLSSAGHRAEHGIDFHVPRSIYNATAAPAVTDDSGDGYGIGSTWIDTTNDKAYVCTDATLGAAVWKETSAAGGGMLKTAGAGFFFIPAGPSLGTSVSSSASANTYGSYTELIASTAAAIYIVGCTIRVSTDSAITYSQLQIGTGPATETNVGEWKVVWAVQGATSPLDEPTPQFSITFPYPIPVATATRIACRVADSFASAIAHSITLHCINQADLVSI